MTEIIPSVTDDLARSKDHRKSAAYGVNPKAPATQDAYRSD
jgi:hypothetical protein